MTVTPFTPDPMRLTYVQVAEHIADRIEIGELAGGRRMPPERELAEEYGVAYSTIRRAMQCLRDSGLIVTVHGRGTYVVPKERREL